MERCPGRSSILAADSISRRIFVLRVAASGPWQLKHLSEKMGRMSRLNSIGGGSGRAVETKATKQSAARNGKRQSKHWLNSRIFLRRRNCLAEQCSQASL